MIQSFRQRIGPEKHLPKRRCSHESSAYRKRWPTGLGSLPDLSRRDVLAATALNVLRLHLWVHHPGNLHRFFIISRNFWLNFVHYWQKVIAGNNFVITS
jgi:hypothetical protein